MDSRSVTNDVIHGGGQLRAYGDHVWEGYLTFSVPEGQKWASKFGHDAEGMVAKQYIRCFVSEFSEVPDGRMSAAVYFSPRLDKLTQIEPGRWYYRIISPYTD
jgi:hypothetical protein